MENSPVNPQTPIRTEVISEALTVEYFDNHIFLFRFTYSKITRQIVDEWHSTVVNVTETNLNETEPTKTIYDIRQTQFSLTPYLRAKADDLITRNAHRMQWIGLVVERNLATQLLRFFLMAFEKKNAKTRIFYNKEDALAWLQQVK
jgi:hypothetical protein